MVFVRVFWVVFLTGLLFAGSTDADLFDNKNIGGHALAASTMAFSNKDSATLQEIGQVINVEGLKPGGFRVSAFRIKKDGEMGFEYRLKISDITGEGKLCEGVEVKLMKSWREVYSGSLADLEIMDIFVNSDYEDWMLVVGIGKDRSDLKGKTCAFSLITEGASGVFSDKNSISGLVQTSEN